MKKQKNRLVLPPARFTAPPRGTRIRDQVMTATAQHGEVPLDSKTAEGCSVRRIAGRVKHGVAPLFLEFRGGPSVLLCTPDREEVRIPANDLKTVRAVYSSIQSCAREGRGEDGEVTSSRLLGKCVLKIAHQYGVKPVGKKRALAGLRAPPRSRMGTRPNRRSKR